MTATRTCFADTRDSLHRVAEHVLAALQFAQVGDIRLRYAPGGFETRQPLRGNRRLGVRDGKLIVSDDLGVRSVPLTTLGELAAAVGAEPGLPAAAYPPATPLYPGQPLVVDPDDARLLGQWYGLADQALRRFAGSIGAGPLEPVIWPEHFDIAITVDAVNYGASPGDEHFAEPYLYVGPFAGPPAADGFWNAPFGAALGIAQVQSVADAMAFFQAGRHRLTGRR
jgi:hypothetical protein